jgi:hypothetical protein
MALTTWNSGQDSKPPSKHIVAGKATGPEGVDRHVIPQGCRHGIPQVRASVVGLPCPW